LILGQPRKGLVPAAEYSAVFGAPQPHCVQSILRRLAPQSLFIMGSRVFVSGVLLSRYLFGGCAFLSRCLLGGPAFCVLRAPQSLFVWRPHSPQSLFVRRPRILRSRAPQSLFGGHALLSRYLLGGSARVFCISRAPQSLFVWRPRNPQSLFVRRLRVLHLA
jgi:hypothetical protein